MKKDNFTFSKFTEADFEEYKSWYADEILNKALGPMDEEWLEYVLNHEEGEELVVKLNALLLAVVGIAFPDKEHPFYVITDLAVNPNYRRHGIGKVILEYLYKKYTFNNDFYWVAYVDINNTVAQLFFEKNLWIKEPAIENEMITYHKWKDRKRKLILKTSLN